MYFLFFQMISLQIPMDNEFEMLDMLIQEGAIDKNDKEGDEQILSQMHHQKSQKEDDISNDGKEKKSFFDIVKEMKEEKAEENQEEDLKEKEVDELNLIKIQMQPLNSETEENGDG